MAALGWLYRGAVIVLACLLMTVIVVVMGVQVFYRYVLNDSLIWAEELCGYLLAVMTFLFVGAAFQNGEMVSIRLIVDLLAPRVRLLFLIPSFAAMIAFLVVLAAYATQFARLGVAQVIPAAGFIASALLGRDTQVSVSMYWLYMTIPVGCLLLAGHLAVTLARMAMALAGRGDPEAVLAPDPLVPPEENR